MSISQRLNLLLASALVLLSVIPAAAGPDYRYISAADLETRLQDGEPTILVDIQVEEEYTRHHIKGATPTYAYPVKNDADRARLDAVMAEIETSDHPVVIVCPRGGGGAKRTWDELLSRGVPAERLLILEKGQQGWACMPLTETGD